MSCSAIPPPALQAHSASLLIIGRDDLISLRAFAQGVALMDLHI